MRLQITAYSGLRVLRQMAADEELEAVRDGIAFAVHPCFRRHAEGLDSRLVYLAHGQFQFNAGGFSGHVCWLERLARLVGIGFLDLFWHSPRAGPFTELLDFADSDATMGPAVCTKLARDFRDWASSAARHHERSFRQKYALWRHAYEVAAIEGCVA